MDKIDYILLKSLKTSRYLQRSQAWQVDRYLRLAEEGYLEIGEDGWGRLTAKGQDACSTGEKVLKYNLSNIGSLSYREVEKLIDSTVFYTEEKEDGWFLKWINELIFRK